MITRRAFLKTAAGVAITATVTDPIGEVASFLAAYKQFYTAHIMISSDSIVLLHSIEHLSVGDAVVSNANGLIRKQRSDEEHIVGFAVAMAEDLK